ncbi:MAG: hydrogenase [Desulfuromonadales bacterium]|nr:hydrogenase [Desulfuromonadales bacterium]
MLIFLLTTIPLLGALAAGQIPSNTRRPLVLPVVACIHLLLVIAALMTSPPRTMGGWIHLDAVGKIFLLEFSVLFAACAFYAVNYLKYRKERDNRALCIGFPVCLSAMTLATVAHHLGLLWLAIETTTVAMAPLVYFNRNARSIEATWKYMLICSIGIAMALLGLLFLGYSTVVAGFTPSLVLERLQGYASGLPSAWLNAAFVLMLVGYGTKMGLAPMHTWKPDAYGEAPGLVGAMLAGGLANCGLLGLIRIYQICMAATDVHFYRSCLIGMGLFSIALAAIFLVRQTDIKRMLAYSSVEHMGLFAVALGLGGKALYGVMLHLIGNGLAKGVLFLTSGNIHRAFASKNRDVARGTLKRAPWTGALFLAGFIAMTGSPPFLPFASEFVFFSAAFSQGHVITGSLLALLLMLAFLGMSLTVVPVVFGDPPKNRERTKYHDTPLLTGPPLVLLIILGILGIWLPQPLHTLVSEAAALLEGAR